MRPAGNNVETIVFSEVVVEDGDVEHSQGWVSLAHPSQKDPTARGPR